MKVCRAAGRWYAAIQCEVPDHGTQASIGSTVGSMSGVSGGTRHQVQRALRASRAPLRRAQQGLSRKQRSSRNRDKAQARVAKLHNRIANVPADWLHKTTIDLANGHDRIVVEDLGVAGMVKNHRHAISIAIAGFSEFRRMLDYKTKDRGTEPVLAGRWSPSSNLCGTCGAETKHLALAQRDWECTGLWHQARPCLERGEKPRRVRPCRDFHDGSVRGALDRCRNRGSKLDCRKSSQ